MLIEALRRRCPTTSRFGQAAGVEGRLRRLLHVGQVLHRQEGHLGDQHLDVVGHDRGGDACAATRRWRSSTASGASTDQIEGLEPQGQGRLLQEVHLDPVAGRQEGRQADQPVAPDRLRGVGEVEEQGAGGVPRRRWRASRCSTPRHAVTTNHTPINYGQRRCPSSSKTAGRWSRRRRCSSTRASCRTTRRSASTTRSSSRRIQGVETGRLTPDAATTFVVDELENELGKDVIIAKCAPRTSAPERGRPARRTRQRPV